MAIRNPHDLAHRIPRGKRLMALDIGQKTIGLALSDPGLSMASPLTTIRRTKFTADIIELARHMREHDVGGLVIGLPVNMDGTEGPRCQSVRDFGRNVIDRADIFGVEPEITFWDERLSTAAVERMMIDADLSRAKRAKAVDKAAASYILQGTLDAIASERSKPV